MISRSHRFRGRKAIGEVHRRGTGSRNRLFGVKILANSRTSSFRVAIVVSKKVHKSAVVRNRIRRRFFACLRQAEFSGLGAYDVVVTIFEAEISKKPSGEITSQLKKMLEAAGAFKSV